ncbi:MAG: hypothetical protein AMJ94_06885 [Deltaproteobacteria bacterium SM23_61]|nr:MAG: hypothetical protein AMJ94_06885 [Deltaproteobacteria bacterium SM23_61]
MKRLGILVLLVILTASCAYLKGPKTLDQEKAQLVCVQFKKGIPWAQISDKFGEPDSVPLPQSGSDLGRNTRIYKSKIIIFYTDLQEIKENEKIRFREAVINIEICNKK